MGKDFSTERLMVKTLKTTCCLKVAVSSARLEHIKGGVEMGCAPRLDRWSENMRGVDRKDERSRSWERYEGSLMLNLRGSWF